MSDNLDNKPKCFGCGNVGEEPIYIFIKAKRGKGGKWWHFGCWTDIHKEVTGVEYTIMVRKILSPIVKTE